jgi:hypothetical protein
MGVGVSHQRAARDRRTRDHLAACSREPRRFRQRRPRLLGALLATVALGGIVYTFIEAPKQQWGSRAVLAALLVGVAAAMMFVVVELRARSPMLPLRLFRIRDFSGANLLTLLLSVGIRSGLGAFRLSPGPRCRCRLIF